MRGGWEAGLHGSGWSCPVGAPPNRTLSAGRSLVPFCSCDADDSHHPRLQVKVTGKKYEDKLYKRHSGRPGGMKVETYRKLQERIPERILEKAIKGMLPKGRLGRQLFTNLKVYKGPEHPHEAQNPEPMELPHCVFQGIYGGST